MHQKGRCNRNAWVHIRRRAMLATLGILWLMICCRSLASYPPDVMIDAVLVGRGQGNELGNGDLAAETIRMKGGSLRADFDAGEGRRGLILQKRSGYPWLIISTSHRAVPADHVPIGKMTRPDASLLGSQPLL